MLSPSEPDYLTRKAAALLALIAACWLGGCATVAPDVAGASRLRDSWNLYSSSPEWFTLAPPGSSLSSSDYSSIFGDSSCDMGRSDESHKSRHHRDDHDDPKKHCKDRDEKDKDDKDKDRKCDDDDHHHGKR